MIGTHRPVQPEAKSLLRSKTFWVNVLGAGAQVVNAGALHAVNPIAGILLQAALNIAIRLVTDEPVTVSGRAA